MLILTIVSFLVNKASTAVEKTEDPIQAQVPDKNQTDEVEQGETTETKKCEEEQTITENETTAEPPKKEKDKSDSDYEDNITIKMPTILEDSTSVVTNANKEHVSYSSFTRLTILIPQPSLVITIQLV